MAITPLSCSDQQLTESVWLDRWQALSKMMDHFVGGPAPSGGVILAQYAGQTVPRWGILQPLIERLRIFALADYNFFQTGFTQGYFQPASPPASVPSQSVYSALLNQTSYDLDVIQSIVLQRLSGLSIETAVLNEADQLAQFALQPAIDAGLLEADTATLTYFQKTPIVRVIPYAPVALIGIPFTTLQTPSDLLSTAHEAGHYVFWRAQVTVTVNDRPQQKHLYKVLREAASQANLPPWCLVWLEEMFADIYGCLILGPAVAASCQEMQHSRTEDEFCRSDGDHPVPWLRPIIYHKVLQNSRYAVRREWGNKLAQRWTNMVAARSLQNPLEFVVSESQGPRVGITKHSDQDVRIDAAIDVTSASLNVTQPVERLISIILSAIGNLETYVPNLPAAPALPPAEPDYTDATICVLYDWFETFRQAVVGPVNVPNTLPAINLADTWSSWCLAHGFDPVPKPMTLKDWLTILESGGWTTELPQVTWP